MSIAYPRRLGASRRLATLWASLLASWLVLMVSACDSKSERKDGHRGRKDDTKTLPHKGGGEGGIDSIHKSGPADDGGDDTSPTPISPRAREGDDGDDGKDVLPEPGPEPEPQVGPGPKPQAGPGPQAAPRDEQRQADAVSRMAYNAPKEMTQGEEILVSARITADPHEPLQENFPGPRPVAEKELPYRPGLSMCVELVGGGFEITPQPKGTEHCHKQKIPTEGHVDWTWSVVPKQSVQLQLTYEVYFFDAEGHRSTRASHNQRELVEVKISVRSWIDAHIVWVAGVITALIGAFLAIRKLVLVWRKEDDDDEDDDEDDDAGKKGKKDDDDDDADKEDDETPSVQDAKEADEAPSVQDAKEDDEAPSVQDAKEADEAPSVQDAKEADEAPSVQDAKEADEADEVDEAKAQRFAAPRAKGTKARDGEDVGDPEPSER